MIFQPGDRVYFLDNGEADGGTVVTVATTDLGPYIFEGDVAVQFDNDGPDDLDYYTPGQLGSL